MVLYGSMKKYSYRYALCYSLDDFINLIKGYLQFKD